MATASSLTFRASFYKHLAEKKIDLSADTLKVYLSNVAPTDAGMSLGASVTQITGGTGYTAGGIALTIGTATLSNNAVYKVTFSNKPVWTAAGGSMGPFRYAYLVDTTPVSPASPIVGHWDLGSAVTLTTGQTLTLTFSSGSVRLPT